MDKKLKRIFNECIERLLQGETIDDCLKSYPDVADKLEPLLKTAVDISWKATKIEPRPVFKTMTRARVQGAFIYAQQQKQQQPKQGGFFSLQRAWIPALSVVLVLILSSAGTVAASSNALPDETLYPVKEAAENTRLAFTFSDAGKAKYYVQLAETRSYEIVEMAIQGKTEIIVEVTEKLTDHLEKADMAIKRVEASGIEQIQKLQPVTIAPAVPEDDSEIFEEPSKQEAAPDKPTTAPAVGTTEESKLPEGPSKQEVAPKPATAPAVGTTEEGKLPEQPPKPGIAPDEPTLKSGDGITTKSERIRIPEAEQLRKKLRESLSNNLLLLQDALNKTPEKSRVALIEAIEASNKTREQIQREIDESDSDIVTPADNGDKIPAGNVISDNTTDSQEQPDTNQVPSDNTTTQQNQSDRSLSSGNSNTDTGNSDKDNTTDTSSTSNKNQLSPDHAESVSDNVTEIHSDS